MIGNVIKIDDVKYTSRVHSDPDGLLDLPNCHGCDLLHLGSKLPCHKVDCMASEREDNTAVIYKKI